MATNTDNNQGETQPFLDHLDALRWHLIRSFIAVFVLSVVAFINKNFVFDGLVLAPARTDFWTYESLCWLSNKLYLGDNLCIQEMGFRLSNIHMAGQFTQHIFISFALGVIVGFPYLLFEVWRFIRPGLTKAERKYGRNLILFSSLLFFLGVLFGYYMLSPMSIQFLGSYRVTQDIANVITLRSFISTLASVIFAAAIIFEIPVLIYFLSRMGLVTPDLMRHYRKHALISVLVLSAILTPPDLTSQVLLCIPFVLIYEFSIKIAKWIYKREA